jgi:2-hydroxychromene-2-carboxylate isomerase
MGRRIDYYFTIVSPWAYLGLPTLRAIAARHGAEIAWRPVPLQEVFAETGGLPLAKRPPARRAYRWAELRRWREARGLPLVLQPRGFPADPSFADRCVIAAAAAGHDPGDFAMAAHRAVWAEERDIRDEAEVERILGATLPDAAAVAAAARGEEAARAYAANREAALAAGVFGSPTYVVEGEPFWGQDRLEMLDAMLAAGRAPYPTAPD